MSYTSPSAKALAAYRETHPQNIVWSPERKWHDAPSEAQQDAEVSAFVRAQETQNDA